MHGCRSTSRRDLGRVGRWLGVRRPGRRNPLLRIPSRGKGRAVTAADRGSGQAVDARRQGPAGTGRGPPPPRRVHQDPAAHAASRKVPPRPRIVEHVIADLKNGPLAHLPSGRFAANAAWLALAGMAHNLARAAGCLASTFHTTARPPTVRDQLINIPARIATVVRDARSGRASCGTHAVADPRVCGDRLAGSQNASEADR